MKDNSIDRRDVLKASGLSATSLLASTTVTGSASAGDPEPSVTFEDQKSDGRSVTIKHAVTDTEAFVVIRDMDGDYRVWGPNRRLNLAPGESASDVTLRLDPFLVETQELRALLWESNGPVIDEAVALVTLDGGPTERIDGVDTTLVAADPNAGFEYPYYLYAPATLDRTDPKPLLVEPTNTGSSTDDFEIHLEAGRNTVEGTTREIALELGVPVIVPVFPRPRAVPVNWTHYVHQLDDTTMSIEEGPLERVDRQLLNMVEHAREYLETEGYPVSTDGILLNGFSASGNFVDRFTVLHPEEVISVTAGGLNGMTLLPLEEYDGQELPYHVGLADVDQLIGELPDLDALDETNQFLYMGAEDENDTIPYTDAWTDDDLRELAVAVYGDDMIAERFSTCQNAYQKAGVDAQFHVYEDAGHTSRSAVADVVEFHRRSINGEDVSEFGQDVGPTLHLDVSSTTASIGDVIDFDASDSTAEQSAEIITYQWEFGDGSTATGETATHAYEEDGEFTVTLTVITDRETHHETTEEINISGDEGDVNREDDEGDANREDDDGEADDESDDVEDGVNADTDDVPGFGIGGALASLGGTAYLLKRRITDDGTQTE